MLRGIDAHWMSRELNYEGNCKLAKTALYDIDHNDQRYRNHLDWSTLARLVDHGGGVITQESWKEGVPSAKPNA